MAKTIELLRRHTLARRVAGKLSTASASRLRSSKRAKASSRVLRSSRTARSASDLHDKSRNQAGGGRNSKKRLQSLIRLCSRPG